VGSCATLLTGRPAGAALRHPSVWIALAAAKWTRKNLILLLDAIPDAHESVMEIRSYTSYCRTDAADKKEKKQDWRKKQQNKPPERGGFQIEK